MYDPVIVKDNTYFLTKEQWKTFRQSILEIEENKYYTKSAEQIADHWMKVNCKLISDL